MIKIYLSSYKGYFTRQLDYISENAWIFSITKLFISQNFFNDFAEMKYFPKILKSKENITLEYQSEFTNLIDLSNTNINDLVSYYVNKKDFFIKFSDLVDNKNQNQNYFIQIINRINFKKLIENNYFKIFIGYTQRCVYYIVYNKLSENNYYELDNGKIVLQSNENLIKDKDVIINKNGFLIYYQDL